jgi:hypothetical protein
MQQCISHLRQDYAAHLRKLHEDALLAAALLHDIGHSPFSHATEEIFGDHEQRAIEIIADSGSQVNRILRKRAPTLPSRVCALIERRSDATLWQKALISSQLDVDRLDYLRRDSLCSGAEYGNFDWFRIIHTMRLEEKVIEGRQKGLFIVWPEKSKYALEEYIFSRFYMYQSVYFHHTTRGFEGLLQKILRRAQDRANQNGRFADALLPPMQMIAGTEKAKDGRRFQNCTDHVLLGQVAIWQNHDDKVLSDLSTRLISRKGIGWIEIAAGTPFEMSAKIGEVRQYLDSQNKDHNYYFIEDSTEMTPYKPYSSASAGEEQTSVNSIMLFDPDWPPTGFLEITEVPSLDRLRAITGTSSSVLRYYFPKEHEKEIKKLLS